MSTKGMIFDIQSFSVHDGPGCRTNVFLAGCPLRCLWCSNPESWEKKKQLLFSEHSCRYKQGCRACQDVCPRGAITLEQTGKPLINRSLCRDCESFECTFACPNRAIKQCVREMSVDELLEVLRRDFSHWGPEGGVTFSGGDPMMQPEFLIKVLEECRKWQIHTAIETEGCTPREVFLKIMGLISFAFVDIKHMDPEKHRLGTGMDNRLILSNLEALAGSDWKGRLVLRQPVIAGYNDSIGQADQIIAFMKTNNLYEINLLPFHRLGQTKWEQLGKVYEYSGHGDISEEELSGLQGHYLDCGIACYTGDDTPF